jgi:hypothetical protein
LTALVRRPDAANSFPLVRDRSDLQLWQLAVPLRQEWLDHGTSTRPADRATAERQVVALYARLQRPAPHVEWVESPLKALASVRGRPTLDDLYRLVRRPRPTSAPPPVASDVAMLVSRLRAELSAGVGHSDPELVPARKNKKGDPWPEQPAVAALSTGVPLGVVLHQNVRLGLYRSLAQGFAHRVRDSLRGHGPLPVCWYGQQEASWIGYYDVLARLGLARYGPREAEHLGEWAALARSCGWWWPGEDVCVMVERPATVEFEPVPGARLGELRVRSGSVSYRDGWRPAVG